MTRSRAGERAPAPIGDTSWMDQAACQGMDGDLFFPEPGQSTREAKATCARCPVRAACLEYATVNREKFGIWGGISAAERRQLRSIRWRARRDA